MKLTNRAKALLDSTTYTEANAPAISALVAFASQNSGIDPRNYFSDWRDSAGRRAFAAEQKSISADFARFRDALREASVEGVTDADVIAEAPHAFSGRLEWSPQGWSYTKCQYFPTEYRKAAAIVLEYATRRVRGARPPAKRAPATITELKALNKENGGCWFDRGSMRFFNCRIESPILGGRLFVSSERQDDEHKRLYTVRSFDDKGSIDTVGEFQEHSTRAEAMAAAKAHLKANA